MTLDYNIYDFIALRLVDPTAAATKVARRQLDPLLPNGLNREPDVVLAPFGPGAPGTAQNRLGDAGDNQECSFGQSGFCVEDGGAPIAIPFDTIGSTCRIEYSPATNMRRTFINYVRPILQLSLLDRGALAVHSAAVSLNGRGILLAGWAESGKTEAMLGFMHHGASFVSDKWTIVADDGAIAHFPTPMTLRGWMLRYFPELGKSLKATELIRARAATVANAVTRRVRDMTGLTAARMLEDLSDLGSRVSVTPGKLFGNGTGNGDVRIVSSAPLSTVFLLITGTGGDTSVRPADSSEVAARLADCAVYERRSLLNLYTKFRYAFPSRRSHTIEESRQKEEALLAAALDGKATYIVETPFPFNPLSLYEALSAYC